MIISGRYEVTGLLGQGGMGVVYQVRDTTRGRENALKTLLAGHSEEIVERFLVEAQVMFRLEHPNIVRVLDFGKDADTYFLAMELIRGRNLRQLLTARTNQGFPLRDVVRIGIEIAAALDYAHTQKPEAVVHRDIKPVNIMVEDETGRVVVTDFGIAKLMANTGEARVTDLSRTVFAGTVPYSAPEQFQPIGPARRLDARVDIYALGMVLFEIYTGRHFFAGLSAEEVEQHHRSREEGTCVVNTPHVCDHKVELPDAPAAFAAVLHKAIAHGRDERYRSAGDMLADLQQYAIAESIQACEVARVAAESAGAPDAAPTNYKCASDLAQNAEAAQQQGDYTKAIALFQSAERSFSAATAEVDEGRAKRAVESAKTSMQLMTDKATERDLAAVAPDAVRRAAELAAAAEENVEHGQLEDAVKQYQEGEEVLRAALVRTHPEGPRHAIEEELPALYAAREGAERAGATTLAADAFTAAVNDQQELEAVLEAGELTRARELLPKVRAGFAAATTAAVQAKAKRGADAARAVMERARAAARETGADQLVSEEWAEAQALELEGEATEKREHWRRASMLYRAATRGYEDVRVKALRHAEERKLAEAVTAARTAMEAARARAESAGAPTAAAERYAAAAACAQRAADAADDAAGMAAAAADFAQAAEGFDAAAAAAADAERARRSELAKMLATVEEARQHAMEAGAEGHAEFAAATDALAAARRALDAGGLDAVPRLAAEAERAFTVTLGATTEAAEQRAVTARTTAELAGADDDTTTSARDAFRLGEQRREEGALRVAAMAFHDAAASYEAATEACATAAHEGAAAATVAANDARAAEAVELAADAYRTAVAEGEAAAAALATGRFTEAKTAFRVAAQSFRAAAEAATAERDRLDALRTEEVRKAVDAGNAALRTALLAGDGDKVAELYTADAEVIRTGAPIVSGRPAIAEFWKGALGGKVTKLAIEMRTLESSGNLAIASGSIEITNGDRGTSISHSVAVWKREAGSWKLHRDTWSEEGPVAKSG